MAHSPGPWKVLPAEPDKPYLRVRGTQLGARYKIANVLPLYDGEAAYPHEVKETQDNARLIGAATELLATLRAMREFLEPMRFGRPSDDHRADELDRQACEVIFKATGERP